MSELEVRQRGPKKSEPAAAPPAPAAPTLAARVKAEDSSFSLLDIARTLVFLLLASSAISWFVTRDSFVWNVQRPAFTRPEVWRTWMNGPMQFTDAELKKYDGTDPELPIYLAVNGSIYDVTKGRRHYGPKGTYHFFAGADASRAFVSSCFDTDITPDMRGVEEMFMPKDDPEVDRLYTSGQLKALKAQERRKAKEDVYKALKHWVDFFENSPKYVKVGMVKRPKGWETMGDVPKLCAKAESNRKSRKPPTKE